MPRPRLQHHAHPATNSMRGVAVSLDHHRPSREVGDGIGMRWCYRQVAIDHEPGGARWLRSSTTSSRITWAHRHLELSFWPAPRSSAEYGLVGDESTLEMGL
jgi:hypothetical protein